MGSALLHTDADLEFAGSEQKLASAPGSAEGSRLKDAATVSRTADELRAEVAARLAAHLSRRGAGRPAAGTEPVRPAASAGRSAKIAAAVAERYARTPSYRAVLAAAAERAVQQARAAAEVAAVNAQAVAAAQQRLLAAYDEHVDREAARPETARASVLPSDAVQGGKVLADDTAAELELWPELREAAAVAAEPERGAAVRGDASTASVTGAATTRGTAAVVAEGLTVRLYEQDVRLTGHAALATERGLMREGRGYRDERRGYVDERGGEEAMALDDEIAFRQAPVFEEPAGPPVALPANLIEFPRQLVAARKARPRYAEGPLRDEMEAAGGDGQLRIFEVDPAQISTCPVEAETQPAQWTSLWLDAPARTQQMAAAAEEMPEPVATSAALLQPASLGRRAAAGAINLGIVGLGVLAFAAIFVSVAGHGAGLNGAMALLAQGGLQARSVATIGLLSGAFLALLYHGLFFWFSCATPGMRCVRIALCTFEDESPTQAGVRRRMAAALLSGCSLGMGFAWAALDEERLTWHDRMSRMYLRRY